MKQKLSHRFIAKMIQRYTPQGWRVVEREHYRFDGTSGKCFFEQRIISCPPILDHYSLFVFLHEVAHAKLHSDVDDDKPIYLLEYEAERFAIQTFKKHKLTVSREIRAEARNNVLSSVLADRAAAIKIDRKVWKWVDPKAPERDKRRYQKRRDTVSSSIGRRSTRLR